MGPIELDTTLHDLYKLDNEDGPDHTLVYAIPAAKCQMKKSVPMNKKYAYQGPQCLDIDADVQARASICAGPQSHAFAAGKMPLVLFDVDSNEYEGYPENEQIDGLRSNVSKVFGEIAPEQQPNISFVDKPDDIPVAAGHKAGVLHPMDCLQHLPGVISPDLHYELLSKRTLVTSGIPTAKSEIVDTQITPAQLQDEKVVDADAQRMMKPVIDAIAPFVVKMPQALAGQGVWVVKNEEEQADAVKVLLPEVKKMLHQMTEENKHLCPANLVIQEMIQGSAVCLSLFITKAGRPVFTCCTEQYFDSRGQWGGGFLDYRQQDKLADHYSGIASHIAKFLHEKGYYGPVGADIMTDLDGTQLCIDLNVRASGSYSLGFLRNHFSTKRNFHDVALLYPLALKGPLSKFQNNFAKELEEGKMVICGWAEGRAGPGKQFKYSICSIVFGGENPTALRELIDRVSEHKVVK